MYATANEYLRLYRLPENSLENNHTSGIPPPRDTIPRVISSGEAQREEPKPTMTYPKSELRMRWAKSEKSGTTDPSVWGPAFWFSLHVSAVHYPDNPSEIVRERMKSRILAIPYEIPCSTCRPHAISFIEGNRDRLDKIVSGKHELGKFYVDFHNKVNQRYGKRVWTYEEAYSLYSGNVQVSSLTYN